jgi:hypothetical protein
VENQVAEEWWRYGGRRGGSQLQGCFVKEGIVVNVEGREKTPELSRVRDSEDERRRNKRRTELVEMWRASGRQQTSRVFADEEIAAEAAGLVKNSKPLRERR